MTIDVTIRSAAPCDASAMKKCVEAAYRPYLARMGKPPGPMLQDYAEVAQQHTAMVAEAHGAVVGVLVLIRMEAAFLLDNVAVHPEWQGQGLGRSLLELAESTARQQGYAHLDLYTHECMTENIAFYKRLGYAETRRALEHGYHRVYMRKMLSRPTT